MTISFRFYRGKVRFFKQITTYTLDTFQELNCTFYINRNYQIQQSRPIPRTALLFIIKSLLMRQPYQDRTAQLYVVPDLVRDDQSYQTLSHSEQHCPAKQQEDEVHAQVQ